jgi:hypothetical protein
MAHDRNRVETLDDALAVYFEVKGEHADQPSGGSGYDDEGGGWLLENIRGPLALVRDDGTVVDAVYDDFEGEWFIPGQADEQGTRDEGGATVAELSAPVEQEWLRRSTPIDEWAHYDEPDNEWPAYVEVEPGRFQKIDEVPSERFRAAAFGLRCNGAALHIRAEKYDALARGETEIRLREPSLREAPTSETTEK